MSRPLSIEVGACPVPAGVGSVLVYGGTFDPPHLAHVELPKAARDRLGLAWLLYVPAARNPLKADGPAASDADRIEMLRAALAGPERVSICTAELDRPGPSYTVETLRVLRARLPGTRLRLLLGADQAASFHRWREPREIMRLAPLAVMLRSPMETPDTLMQTLAPHWSEQELGAWRGAVVPVPLIDAAATDLRVLLRDPANNAAMLNRSIAPGVLQIIRERGLYQHRLG